MILIADAPAPVRLASRVSPGHRYAIVERLWREIDSIHDPQWRGQVTQTWTKARERSPLSPGDLKHIPVMLLVPNCSIEHKPCVVPIARDRARAMPAFRGRALPIDEDVVIAGAILADVGQLLEYELGPDGKSRQSEGGEALRHPFTGVALALDCLVPDSVLSGTEFRSWWMK